MTRGKNRRLRLIPSHLPLIRDKLAEYERVALKEQMAAHTQYERSMETAWNSADNLAIAQLWWISRDMTALAEDTVQAGDFPKSDAPAQSGLIFFDGDVQTVTFSVTDDATGRKVGDAHVSALFWQCDGNGDIELMGFTDHPCALKECDAKSFSLRQRRFQWVCRRFPMVLRFAACGMGVERGTAYLRGKTGETRYGASLAAAFRPGNTQGQDAGAA